jgi:hypothetical protein
MNIVKSYWLAWNPARLRRLLLLKDQQIANCNNGWGNMHTELLIAKDKCKDLEAEIARLERLNNG